MTLTDPVTTSVTGVTVLGTLTVGPAATLRVSGGGVEVKAEGLRARGSNRGTDA